MEQKEDTCVKSKTIIVRKKRLLVLFQLWLPEKLWKLLRRKSVSEFQRFCGFEETEGRKKKILLTFNVV